MQNVPGGDVERGEEGCGPMAFVIMRHGSGPTLFERKTGLRTIQCLDLALLIHREDNRAFGWIDVQTYEVAEFLNEEGILGELEILESVRLQPVRAPEPRDVV